MVMRRFITIVFCLLLALFQLATRAFACDNHETTSSREKESNSMVMLQPLPKGISTWVYRYRDGVSRQVKAFNEKALPQLQFRYFFPYGGSLGFDEAEKGKAIIHYTGEITSAYSRTLPPGLLIMPIFDGRTDAGEFDGWTDDQYREAARLTADKIIADSHAAGIQVDIEPFRPGHLPFYRHLREMLNAAGKYSTMFVGPREPELLTKIFQACDIVVMSGYDLSGEGSDLETYRARLEEGVALFQQVAEATGGHYLVGIPVAASWGEYEYLVDNDGNRIESGVKQEEFVRAALTVVKAYQDRPQYLGTSLWHMSDPETDFEQPEKATKLTKFPNIIRESIWRMLENY